MWKIVSIISISLIVCGPLGAKSGKRRPKNAKRPVTTAKYFNNNTIKSSKLRKHLNALVPEQICTPQSKVIRCHKILPVRCMKIAKLGVKKCIKKNKIKRMVSSMDALLYSEKIGLCLRKQIDPKLKKYKKKKCDWSRK